MGDEVSLIRRFVNDFFNRHDTSVCPEIMSSDYELAVGGHLISGRDDKYVPAVQSQFDQFPGLGMTVHTMIVAPGRVALHFSEHGASAGPAGPVAAWTGIALYTVEGQRLARCAAVEDYYARRRQLKRGSVDTVEPPCPAPWDTPVLSPDHAAEAVVREWLETPQALVDRHVRFDDEHLHASPRLDFDAEEAVILDLFSSGERVAFHTAHRGRYRSGFDDVSVSGEIIELHTAGIVTVVAGAVVSGRAVRDRQALARRLTAAQSNKGR